MHALGHALFTRLSLEVAIVAKIHQGTQALVNDKNNIASTTAIATPGTAIGTVFFTAKGNHTITTITSLNLNLGRI